MTPLAPTNSPAASQSHPLGCRSSTVPPATRLWRPTARGSLTSFNTGPVSVSEITAPGRSESAYGVAVISWQPRDTPVTSTCNHSAWPLKLLCGTSRVTVNSPSTTGTPFLTMSLPSFALQVLFLCSRKTMLRLPVTGAPLSLSMPW